MCDGSGTRFLYSIVWNDLCRLPDPVCLPAAAHMTRGSDLKSLSFSRAAPELAVLLVDLIHNGVKPPTAVRAELQAALDVHGAAFAEHPLWLSVSSHAPHRAIVGRLAVIVGSTHADFTVARTTGYPSPAAFRKELTAWSAWYAQPRRDCNLRDGRALARAASLFGSADGEVTRGKAASTGAASECDETDDEDGSDSEHEHEAEQAAVHGDEFIGVSLNNRVQDAVRTVQDDTVVNGLLANQRLGHLPKGALCSRCAEAGVTASVRLTNVACVRGTGTCANEAVHQFLKQMIHQTMSSIDMIEVCVTRVELQQSMHRLPESVNFTCDAWLHR